MFAESTRLASADSAFSRRLRTHSFPMMHNVPKSGGATLLPVTATRMMPNS